MRRRLPVIASVAAAGVTLAASAFGEGASPGGEDPRCSAVTKARPGVARNVVYRVRCNFEVSDLVVHTSRRVYVIQGSPRLDNPDPGDRLACRRARRGEGDFSGRALGRGALTCRGSAGAGVRIVGAFRVNGDPCGSCTRISAFGGEAGESVPRIGYFATISRRRPRGC